MPAEVLAQGFRLVAYSTLYRNAGIRYSFDNPKVDKPKPEVCNGTGWCIYVVIEQSHTSDWVDYDRDTDIECVRVEDRAKHQTNVNGFVCRQCFVECSNSMYYESADYYTFILYSGRREIKHDAKAVTHACQYRANVELHTRWWNT